MEENNKNNELTEEVTEDTEAAAEDPMIRKVYTKQQNALYTIISIALFFALYFGVNGLVAAFTGKPYNMYAYPDTVSEGSVANAFELSGISPDNGYGFESARLSRDENGYEFRVLFSGISDMESFAENNPKLVYSDSDEEVRIEFYPYRENPERKEFVYADVFWNTDSDKGTVYLFEWQGNFYAEYVESGAIVLSYISEIMAGQERIPAEQ